MTYRRRFVALVLPLVAAVALGGPASATPSADSSAAALTSYIFNSGTIGLGVMRDYGTHPDFTYDAVLPPGKRTDLHFGWDRAEGFYLGYPYCARTWYWNGKEWKFHLSYGSGPHPLNQDILGQSVARWDVRPEHC